MKSLAAILASIVIMTLAIIASGCSDEDTPPTGTNPEDQEPALQSIVPQDSAEDVPINQGVHMRFSTAMDTSSIRHGFYLSGGDPMHEWMDSVDHYGGMGHMGMMHQQRMMNWIDSLQIHGEWHWNADLDSCFFDPDSSFMPDTDYMMMFDGDQMHGHHGHPFNHHDNDGQYRFYHFHTED